MGPSGTNILWMSIYGKYYITFEVGAWDAKQKLKHKLRLYNQYTMPENSIFKSVFKREVPQFLVILYVKHVIPATFHEYMQVLRWSDFELSKHCQAGGKGDPVIISQHVLNNQNAGWRV